MEIAKYSNPDIASRKEARESVKSNRSLRFALPLALATLAAPLLTACGDQVGKDIYHAEAACLGDTTSQTADDYLQKRIAGNNTLLVDYKEILEGGTTVKEPIGITLVSTDNHQVIKDLVSGTADSPSFSRDGQKIVFLAQTDTGKSTINTMNTDGNEQRVVTSFEPHQTAELPQWSPNGSQIAYIKTDITSIGVAVNKRLHLMDIDGQNDRELTLNKQPNNLSNLDAKFTWLPDGSIVFVSEAKLDGNKTTNEVFRISNNLNAVDQLTNFNSYSLISPLILKEDGTIVFERDPMNFANRRILSLDPQTKKISDITDSCKNS